MTERRSPLVLPLLVLSAASCLSTSHAPAPWSGDAALPDAAIDACRADGACFMAQWNATDDFGTATNPTGVWTYGYLGADASPPATIYSAPTPANFFSPYAPDAGGWYDPNNTHSQVPTTAKNFGAAATAIGVGAGQLWLHGGAAGEFSFVRFTAPTAGTYRIDAQFFVGDVHPTFGAVLLNGATLFMQDTDPSPTYSNPSVALKVGDTLDLAVGPDGDYTYGSTPATFVVTELSSP